MGYPIISSKIIFICTWWDSYQIKCR